MHMALSHLGNIKDETVCSLQILTDEKKRRKPKKAAMCKGDGRRSEAQLCSLECDIHVLWSLGADPITIYSNGEK